MSYLMSSTDKRLFSVNIGWWIGENKCYVLQKKHHRIVLRPGITIFIFTMSVENKNCSSTFSVHVIVISVSASDSVISFEQTPQECSLHN